MDKLAQYPDVKIFLESVRTDLETILSDNMVGFYIWGSVTTGAYKDGLSDIDGLVVLQNDIDDQTLQKLKNWASQLLTKESLAKKIDTVFITQEKINSGDDIVSQGGIEFWQNTLQRTDDCLGDNPIVLDTVRKTGVRLYGPQADEVINPITREEIINTLQQETIKLKNNLHKNFSDLGWRYYVITTLCRILYTHQTAEYLSKKEALGWYQDTFQDHKNLIASALAYYSKDPTLIDSSKPGEYITFINEVTEAIT